MSARHPALREPLLTEEQIRERVTALGREITEAYAGRELTITCVLKGGFIFLADLVRAIEVPCTMDFMVISSYGMGTRSSGVGLTLSYLLRNLETRRPASLEVCSLLSKPGRHDNDVPIRFVGFEIPDDFVVGYGLDAGERFRELPEIWTVDETRL